jgi:hypothetical protein
VPAKEVVARPGGVEPAAEDSRSMAVSGNRIEILEREVSAYRFDAGGRGWWVVSGRNGCTKRMVSG